MNQSSRHYYLAIDTAYEHGTVMVFAEDDIIFEARLTTKFAHAIEIAPAIDEAQHAARHAGGELVAVFCGLGPGSFVGVRIALATALGFSFGRSLPLMGFCSHRALALSSAQSSLPVSVFMKASGTLGYFATYNALGHRVTSLEVIDTADIVNHVDTSSIILTDQPASLHVLSDRHTIHALFGPSPRAMQRIIRERLSETAGLIDEAKTLSPNYVKAPSVTPPKLPRVAIL